MAARRGPRPSTLGYDTACEAASVNRAKVAAPIEARGRIAPPIGRIDLRTRGYAVIEQTLAAGGVHRLSWLSPTLPTEGSMPASARRSV